MTNDHKPIATLKKPTIEAICGGRFRFESEQDALTKLVELSKHFEYSPALTKEYASGLVLWIKGFELTIEEEAEGYLGHYVYVKTSELEDGKWTLRAEKIETALTKHPQKQRAKHRHPDWLHPLLKAVKEEREFPSVEKANAHLEALHSEYPNTSIPNREKLYLMVYEADANPKVQKYIFTLKAQKEGGVKIEYKRNPRQLGENPEPDKQGFFSAKEEIKKLKKK